MTVSWKTWLWRALVAAAILVVLVACFYAEEDWRGVKAWTDCQHELEAKGEELNWTNYIPSPVPDGQNFFKAPMMTEWFMRGATNNGPSPNHFLANPETTSDVITELAASNYLAWCAAFEPDFDKIRNALKRPNARLDGDYRHLFQQPIPNFVSYRIVTQTLAHRAKCHLFLNDPQSALADLTLLHELNQTLVKDGGSVTLVAGMMHIAIAGLYTDAIACGVEGHVWREPQLAALEKQLAQINLLPEVANAFRAERAGCCYLLENLPTDQLMQDVWGSPNAPEALCWWLMPSGWIYQNMAVVATLQSDALSCFDFTNNAIAPYKARAASQHLQTLFRHETPWNILAAIMVPNASKAIETMARNQTWVDQAQIVCALERYRLVNGRYPKSLAALAPRFTAKIPHDIIGGKPLIYSCQDGETFLLYSIGWNETDDSGITAHNNNGTEDRENGDWVWRYPTQ